MILATGVALRLAAVVAGLAAGVVAVYLARNIPQRMGEEVRLRPPAWWAGAILIGGLFGWFAADGFGWSVLPAVVVFGGTTLALALIDLDHQLIPNRVLFPGTAAAGILLAIGALVDAMGGALLRGLSGALAYFAFLLVIALIARGGFGMGDVKLALLLGLFLGYVGWGELATGVILAIVLGGVVSAVLLLLTRRGRKSKFAYGPFLVVGAWLAMFWGVEIADWYLRRG